LEIDAAVGKRIRGDVDHAHHGRTRKAFFERRLHAAGYERFRESYPSIRPF
jgi:hypothetical protein